MQEFIKANRRVIDGLIQSSTTLPEKSAYTTLAYRSLQLGKMWLGQALAFLGTPNPYPESSTPGSPVIEPTADTATLWEGLGTDIVYGLKYMRQEIEGVKSALTQMLESLAGTQGITTLVPTENKHQKFEHAVQKSLDSLTEAKMWYGMELGCHRVEMVESPFSDEMIEKPDLTPNSIAQTRAELLGETDEDEAVPEAPEENLGYSANVPGAQQFTEPAELGS